MLTRRNSVFTLTRVTFGEFPKRRAFAQAPPGPLACRCADRKTRSG